METAIKGDVALIKAWKGDKAGNLVHLELNNSRLLCDRSRSPCDTTSTDNTAITTVEKKPMIKKKDVNDYNITTVLISTIKSQHLRSTSAFDNVLTLPQIT